MGTLDVSVYDMINFLISVTKCLMRRITVGRHGGRRLHGDRSLGLRASHPHIYGTEMRAGKGEGEEA